MIRCFCHKIEIIRVFFFVLCDSKNNYCSTKSLPSNPVMVLIIPLQISELLKANILFLSGARFSIHDLFSVF